MRNVRLAAVWSGPAQSGPVDAGQVDVEQCSAPAHVRLNGRIIQSVDLCCGIPWTLCGSFSSLSLTEVGPGPRGSGPITLISVYPGDAVCVSAPCVRGCVAGSDRWVGGAPPRCLDPNWRIGRLTDGLHAGLPAWGSGPPLLLCL